MSRTIMMISKILPLFLCMGLSSCSTAFDVAVLPPEPRGGEAILVRISGGPKDSFEVTFKGREYVPYARENGVSELFLPLAIGDSGTINIKVQRNNVFAREVKEIDIVVKEREKKAVRLRASDEKMRDRQPMVEKQNQGVLDSLKSVSPDRLWENGFMAPLDARVSAYFALHRQGQAYDYYHKGIDFSAPAGTPVKAANSGKVISSERDLNVYGNIIIIDHGQGVTSCYFHLSELMKGAGDMVKQGEVIGKVGSTGWATGPHLHAGVYVHGQAIDPLWWNDFTKVLNPHIAVAAVQTSPPDNRAAEK